MSVVSDSSPLIALDRMGRLELLHQLYARVLVPPAVRDEVYTRRSLSVPDWIESRPLAAPIDPLLAAAQIGAGEREAIALALQVHATVLLLDDRQARALARRFKLSVVGVGGVLVACKRSGLLSEVRSVLDELIAQGFRISLALRADLLALAGE